MSDFMMEREIQEALTAGENALQSLYAASEQLDSARNWGIVDLLGGGFFTDLIKHSKMGKAEEYLSQARYYLQQFQKELRDVAADDTIQLQTGDFLSFADFFFDGVVADYLVQSRINETRRKVAEAIRRVEELTAKFVQNIVTSTKTKITRSETLVGHSSKEDSRKRGQQYENSIGSSTAIIIFGHGSTSYYYRRDRNHSHSCNISERLR